MATNCFVCKKGPATSSGGGGLCGKQETLQSYLKDLQSNSHTVAFQQKAITGIMASAPNSGMCEGMLREDMQGMAMAMAAVKEEDTDQQGGNRRQSGVVNDRVSQKKWSEVSYVTAASVPRRKVHHGRPTMHLHKKIRMSTASGMDGTDMSQYSGTEYSASEAFSVISRGSGQTTGSSMRKALRKRISSEPTTKTAKTPIISKKDNSKKKTNSGSSRHSKDNVSSAPLSVVDKSYGKGLTFSDNPK